METQLKALLCIALCSGIVVLWLLAIGLYKKAFIETTLNVQVSSGDSEVMSLTANFSKGDSEKSKQDKLNAIWSRIQYRRDQNHAEWLRIKAEEFAKNEQKDPKELKLHALSEAGIKDKVKATKGANNDTFVEVS
jgi:hypothetical protein